MWDQKSERSVLIGYSGNKNGFIVWLVHKRNIILCRNVIFKDDVSEKSAIRPE